MEKRSWANRTDGLPQAEGALQYIPAGDRGMLIYFGGVQTSSNGVKSYVSHAASPSTYLFTNRDLAKYDC